MIIDVNLLHLLFGEIGESDWLTIKRIEPAWFYTSMTVPIGSASLHHTHWVLIQCVLGKVNAVTIRNSIVSQLDEHIFFYIFL